MTKYEYVGDCKAAIGWCEYTKGMVADIDDKERQPSPSEWRKIDEPSKGQRR